MDGFTKFMTETYPRVWRLAYDAGASARKQGLPNACDLRDPLFLTPSGAVLKVYKSAWEQGWAGHKTPAVFEQMEAALATMPLQPYEGNDQ